MTGDPNDVTLRDHLEAMIKAQREHSDEKIEGLRRETMFAHETAEEAVKVATVESKERLKAHNGLIDQMRAQQAHYATREAAEAYRDGNATRISRIEQFQAKIIGALVLVSIVGAANLVKLFAG